MGLTDEQGDAGELLQISGITELREQLAGWRAAGESLALVPTMGNLHAGHLSLVELARREAHRVIVSIFVNPSQFGAGEDLDAYPRTPSADRDKLSAAGVDLLFRPSAESIYPFGVGSMTRVTVPELSAILCGASRPGHFDGVTSVVCRLLNICQPDVAVFGQKDYQQLLLIRRMVADLHMPVTILAAPISRAPDGLALSSRNQYLGEGERAQATAIYAALQSTADGLAAGDRDFSRLEADGVAALLAAGLRPDYFVVRRAADLGPPGPGDRALIILAAAHCGPARLIDNLELNL